MKPQSYSRVDDAHSAESTNKKRPCKGRHIPDRGLMNHMISVCVTAKQRSLKLFPAKNPGRWRKDILGEFTREIFADAIAGVVGVWLWIWGR